MKKLLFLILVFLITGCTTSQTEQSKYYNVFDEQGKRKGYIKERDGHITIYDENWQRKGYLERK